MSKETIRPEEENVTPVEETEETTAENKEETFVLTREQMEKMEGLAGQIPGLVDIKVYTEGLPSSNADVMLDSTFESEAALKGYAVHPAHVAVADGKVRPYTKTRLCLDFEI